MTENQDNGSGNGRDDDEGTQPDILLRIYDKLLYQETLLASFDKRLMSIESSIGIVMNSYTTHRTRISDIENTCEERGKLISQMLGTPIPTPK